MSGQAELFGGEVERVEKVWRDQPRYCSHVWAFVHFCRRQGDDVRTSFHGDRMDVFVTIFRPASEGAA